MKRLSLVILAVLVIVGCSAIVSFAGVKTIKPNQLRPFESNTVYEQCAAYVRSLDTNPVAFTAEIKLPVGKKITKLTYYHEGIASGATTTVILFRTKMGVQDEHVAAASSDDATGLIIPVDGDIYITKIKRGYTYWVYTASFNSSSKNKGIKIYYK